MDLGTSSLSTTLPRTSLSGITDSFCSMPIFHGGILPALSPRSGALRCVCTLGED